MKKGTDSAGESWESDQEQLVQTHAPADGFTLELEIYFTKEGR